MNKFNKYLDRFIKAWYLKQKHVQEIITTSGVYYKDDITYHMPDGKLVVDYGLIYSHEPFSFRLPIILKQLWNSSQNDCVKLCNDLIAFEQRKLRDGGILEQELCYIINIKNVVDYVLKNKFKLSSRQRSSVIGGDFKDKSHFSV